MKKGGKEMRKGIIIAVLAAVVLLGSIITVYAGPDPTGAKVKPKPVFVFVPVR